MNLSDLFQIILGNMNLFFGFILCFLPVMGVARFPMKKIWVYGSIFSIAYVCACSMVILRTGIAANYLLFPSLPVFFVLYWKMLNLNIYKALTVFLVVISIFCFETLYTDIFAARMHFGAYYTDYAWGSSIFSTFVCAGFLAIFWIPASRQVRWLVENYDVFSLWQAGLVWPLVFTAVTVFIIPRNYQTLESDRYFYVYLLIVTLLLFCMLYVYVLLYQAAKTGEEISALERRNHFLGFQSKQYEALTEYISATARLRHDFRHQLATIQNLAESGEIEALKNYLVQYQESAGTVVSLCANPAVNAVASHYNSSCTENGISVSWALHLPHELPMPEPEYCVMLGNLVENAIDACRTLPEKEREISVISQMPTNSILVLIVENTHNSQIRRDKNRIISTKHNTKAIGLVSVQETVEMYHGNLRIDYDDHHFSVEILLNF
ncbi:MAG: GHKL domain-containing protein [Clostridiales bacterium]|nr:GHKL domain-containing protein [Clostridiales bacterium]